MRGQCLCGAITFEVDAPTNHVGVCHCSICRRWAGGPFMVLEGVERLDISGEANLGVYKSSPYGERCFCKTCGSVLFWRSPTIDHIAVSAGAIDPGVDLELTSEIFIDSKPAYYDFANDTKKMTEADVMAAFSADASKDKQA